MIGWLMKFKGVLYLFKKVLQNEKTIWPKVHLNRSALHRESERPVGDEMTV